MGTPVLSLPSLYLASWPHILVMVFFVILNPNPTAIGSNDHRWKPLETEVKLDLSLLKVDYFRHFVTATHSTFDHVSGSGSHDNRLVLVF